MQTELLTTGATESEEEKRKRIQRERKARSRAKEKKIKQAQATESEVEWWQRNRATLLKPDELAAMQEQDAEVREILRSMEILQGEDHELTQIVLDLVKERGVVHLGNIHRDPDIPADWSSRPYWQDSALLGKLEAEGGQTAQFVRFGLLSSLPDWRAVEFVQKSGWSWEKAAELVGYVVTRNTVSYEQF